MRIPSESLGALAQPSVPGLRGDAQISHGIVISAGARSCRRPVAAPDGQRLPELAAGGDGELGEDLGQVVLDGARAEEQLGGDFRVGHARPGQPPRLNP